MLEDDEEEEEDDEDDDSLEESSDDEEEEDDDDDEDRRRFFLVLLFFLLLRLLSSFSFSLSFSRCLLRLRRSLASVFPSSSLMRSCTASDPIIPWSLSTGFFCRPGCGGGGVSEGFPTAGGDPFN